MRERDLWGRCSRRISSAASKLSVDSAVTALYPQDHALTKEGTLPAALLCPSSLLLFGQPAFADDKDRLVGAWKIVSAVVEDVQTKEQKPLYGAHPKGYLILLASGRMMSLLVSEGRKVPHRSMVARLPAMADGTGSLL
jgi:Lipocalin-like domain